MAEVRVLIVEDHPAVSEGIALLLEEDSQLDLVGIARTGGDALTMAIHLQPDVVLMDFQLPDQTGAETSAAIKLACADCAVVFLSADNSPSAIRAAADAGASGYLDKTKAGLDLLHAIHRAAAGDVFLRPVPPRKSPRRLS